MTEPRKRTKRGLTGAPPIRTMDPIAGDPTGATLAAQVQDPDEYLNPPDDTPTADIPKVPTKVPTTEGTSRGTTQGTNADTSGNTASSVDPPPDVEEFEVSFDDLLGGAPDPDEDWMKSGTHMLRYHHAAVQALVKVKWQGYKSTQKLLAAAIREFVPPVVLDRAREKAKRGEL